MSYQALSKEALALRRSLAQYRDGDPVSDGSGFLRYLKNGKLHRYGAPAVTSYLGDEMWYVHGRLHREDGPAVTTHEGTKLWYVKGKLHRTDGPAVVMADGTQQWWVDGVRQMKH